MKFIVSIILIGMYIVLSSSPVLVSAKVMDDDPHACEEQEKKDADEEDTDDTDDHDTPDDDLIQGKLLPVIKD